MSRILRGEGNMKDDELSDVAAYDLATRVDPQYRPVWQGRSLHDTVALANYFLPHCSDKPVLAPTRPRMVKWYCPFARQTQFPSGHRYCINVFTGCGHACEYCYAHSYQPATPSCKKDFRRLLDKDLADLDRFGVPPAPLHMSNSTDCLQPLELGTGDTKYALEQILQHRPRFTTISILTKHPSLAARPDYLALIKALGVLSRSHPAHARFAESGLPALQVEVSLAFWREEARAMYDRCAPSVADRIAGIRALREAGISIVLRIDPLFPHSPLSNQAARTLADFGLAEAQTLDDLEKLILLAKEINVGHVVYSPAKIVKPRNRPLSPVMRAMKEAYAACAAPEPLQWTKGSWRLPRGVSDRRIVAPFLEVCGRHGVKAKFCMADLIETP
jgi:DNA repair photolyase